MNKEYDEFLKRINFKDTLYYQLNFYYPYLNKTNANPIGYYDFCFNQYDVRKRICKWFYEIKFDEQMENVKTFQKFFDFFKRKDINTNNIAQEYETLIKDVISNDKNDYIINYFYWIFNDLLYNINVFGMDEKAYCIKINDLIDQEKYKLFCDEYYVFLDYVFNYSDKLKKKLEKEIKKSIKINITVKEIKTQIENSTLDNELKESIIGRLEDTDIYEIMRDGYIICDLDSCLSVYKKLNGKSPYGEDGNERKDVEPFIINHFKNNLLNFKFSILTEDCVKLY